MSTHRKLVRSAGIIGSLTGVSRVLGFIRDMVIATAFGTGLGAEAFVVSFKLPNLLRDLVGEGAANAAFVPVLTECRENRPKEFWRLVSTLFCVMTVVLVVLACLGVLFAPFVVRLIAPGFVHSADPGKFPLTVALTRVIFPYVLLIGLSALAMGVLNTLKQFTASALGPILLNLSMIASGVFLENRFGPMALVMGVLIGGVLQLGCQVPPLIRSGFKFMKPSFGDPSARQIVKLLIPRAFGSALYQINVFVDSILASFESIVGPGGQSALYYSNRLFQLPLAIFGISLAQAILPTFSAQAVKKDVNGMKETIVVVSRSLAFAVLPAAAGLIALAQPIVRIIFERGKFDAYSTGITSTALFFYAFGLLSCCLIKIFVNAFYAMQDTRTPVKIMCVSVSINVALSVALMGPLKIGGLALASSLSATVNLFLLYRALRARIGPLGARAAARDLVKILGSAAVMGCFAFAYGRFMLMPYAGAGSGVQAALLAVGIAASIAVYFAVTYAVRVPEARKIAAWKRA